MIAYHDFICTSLLNRLSRIPLHLISIGLIEEAMKEIVHRYQLIKDNCVETIITLSSEATKKTTVSLHDSSNPSSYIRCICTVRGIPQTISVSPDFTLSEESINLIKIAKR